ncbi:MAG TPA: polysaccharide deacetylase family protein [Steroidobacteraceae bacterium]|jgi:peptidoglycan/xylan/chitin deacetylase (PgdA/CDA1 family)
MYHRVLPKDSAERKTEQPGMYVSPETLDLHLNELKRHFELVHLDDWLRRAKQGLSLPRLACALTFDDGWRDNYEFALPVLARHGAPATIFLVSSYIGTSYRFWPNRLIELVLREHSEPGSVSFPGKLRLLVDPVLTNVRRRARIHIEDVDPIIQSALKFKEEEIRALVEAAEGRGTTMGSRDTVDLKEIAAMSASGLIRFGSHSSTHFRLHAGASEDRLSAEIVESRSQLMEICNQPVDLFCYPNGVTSAAAVSLVSRHYLGAVITETGWHSLAKDPHFIHRIRVHDDVSSDRDAFLERLSGWL